MRNTITDTMEVDMVADTVVGSIIRDMVATIVKNPAISIGWRRKNLSGAYIIVNK